MGNSKPNSASSMQDIFPLFTSRQQFLGIYNTNTGILVGNFGIVYLAGTHFSLIRGVLAPFLMHPSPLFEEYRSSRQIVQKRSSRQIISQAKKYYLSSQ
jgi:hypothetical protein